MAGPRIMSDWWYDQSTPNNANNRETTATGCQIVENHTLVILIAFWLKKKKGLKVIQMIYIQTTDSGVFKIRGFKQRFVLATLHGRDCIRKNSTKWPKWSALTQREWGCQVVRRGLQSSDCSKSVVNDSQTCHNPVIWLHCYWKYLKVGVAIGCLLS